MTKRGYLFTVGLLLVPLAYGSGAYIPGGGARSESYNQGKALVTANDGCKGCHASYKRSNLKNLNIQVADFVTDCAAHEPCFSDKFNDAQLLALSTYFKQRYKLR